MHFLMSPSIYILAPVPGLKFFFHSKVWKGLSCVMFLVLEKQLIDVWCKLCLFCTCCCRMLTLPNTKVLVVFPITYNLSTSISYQVLLVSSQVSWAHMFNGQWIYWKKIRDDCKEMRAWEQPWCIICSSVGLRTSFLHEMERNTGIPGLVKAQGRKGTHGEVLWWLLSLGLTA